MPRNSSTTYSTRLVEGHQCPDCGIVLAYNSDMSRHKKTHSENRQQIVHRCPWEGCNFASLQKSNMQTHYNTHTGNKTKCCPDCAFRSVDPGSLTRHRKRRHGYIPRPRNRLGVVIPHNDSSATTRTRHRHAPYPLPRSSSSESSASPFVSDVVFVQSKYTAMSLARSKQNDNEGMISSLSDLDPRFFWRLQDTERIARSPSPKLILPAVDTGHHMQENMTFQPREEYCTQTRQTQHLSPATAIENWDFTGLLDANNCSMTLGQQTVPQYLGPDVQKDLGNGHASPLNLGVDFDLALAAQQQMSISGGDSDSTDVHVDSLSAASYYSWATFFAAVESLGSGSSSDASPVSFPSPVPYSSYSPPYFPGSVDMTLESSVCLTTGLTQSVIPVAPAPFDPAWQL